MTFLPDDYINTSNVIIENDLPLSFRNEKQQRLLTNVFYSGAEIPINVPFIAAANVGLFSGVGYPGTVPDVFLSLNIKGSENWWQRNIYSYLFWEFGKSPDIVIDVVSPISANKLTNKFILYSRLRIAYCVVYDPLEQLSETLLQVFELKGTSYIPKNDAWFAGVNLGLTLWNGVFESVNDTWLRWCDESGNVIKTGDEITAEKNVEISQKNAEISQLKQALLLATEMGLKFRFGDEVAGMLSEISAINDVKLLEGIVSQIPQVSSADELRKLYLSE